MQFKDYFSPQSQNYQQFRPTYPRALYEYLASRVQHRHLAWDCATGNGQAAVGLADHFAEVIATDASAAQIRQTLKRPNIKYAVAMAEQTELASASVDLVTVAQAVHWFDFDKFYAEVNRVLRPEGVIAIWCYPLIQFNDRPIQAILEHLYSNVLGAYWPPERAHCDSHYENIPFPFKEFKAQFFETHLHWDKAHLLGYLRTWSATQRYIKQHNIDPIEKFFLPELEKVWPDTQTSRQAVFSIYLRAGGKK